MLFSIVTICKNDQCGLALTYESIAAQTLMDFEWVVIDGNSDDFTTNWLKDLNVNWIRWISEKDEGIYDAMNKGIGLARGEYIIFMNSCDEFADPDVLRQVAEKILTHGNRPDFIYGDAIDVTEDMKGLYKKAKPHSTLWKGMFTSHQAMFFRKHSGLFYPVEYRVSADYAVIARHLMNSEAIVQVDIPVCKFKLGGTNEKRRFQALKEDFLIRYEIMGLSMIYCIVLYLLHYLHTVLKRTFPSIPRIIRYQQLSP